MGQVLGKKTSFSALSSLSIWVNSYRKELAPLYKTVFQSISGRLPEREIDVGWLVV